MHLVAPSLDLFDEVLSEQRGPKRRLRVLEHHLPNMVWHGDGHDRRGEARRGEARRGEARRGEEPHLSEVVGTTADRSDHEVEGVLPTWT